MNNRTVDIVFDGPPGPKAGRFVEVESPPGTSISFGEWLLREDGYWVLRISTPPQPERDREVLESIRIYGSDTLSGRVDGPEDAEWYRGAVVEMTRRAFLGEPVAQREPEGMTYATRWDLLLADQHGELTVRRFDPKRNAIPVWIGTAPKPEREHKFKRWMVGWLRHPTGSGSSPQTRAERLNEIAAAIEDTLGGNEE